MELLRIVVAVVVVVDADAGPTSISADSVVVVVACGAKKHDEEMAGIVVLCWEWGVDDRTVAPWGR